MDRNDLFPYQNRMISFLESGRKRTGLFLDCGLGKTIIMLTVVKDMFDSGKIGDCLCICPKGVAENTWLQESQLWEHTKSLNVSLVIGTEKQRLKALQNQPQHTIYVVSRDNIHWLFQQKKLPFTGKNNLLILDEATSFKAYTKTRRYCALMHKSITVGSKKKHRKESLVSYFDYIVELTGTPASENYANLYALAAILSYGEENPLGKTLSDFREQYMIPISYGTGFPVYSKMKPDAIPRINKKLEGLCVSMRAEDYLDLPEIVKIKRYLTMKEKRYFDMEKHGVITVDNVDIVAGDVLTKYQKLQELSSGFIIDDDGQIHVMNHDKAEAMEELIESTDERMLVMYRFEYEKQQLMKMGGVPLDCPQNIKQWQQGKIRIGLLYPNCSYGLNIQQDCGILVYYTLPLSCEQMEQSVKRIVRQGNSYKTVRIFFLINRNTIDEVVYNLLREKKNILDGLMSYFRMKEGE